MTVGQKMSLQCV